MTTDRNENRPGYKETKIGWIPEEWEAVTVREKATKIGSGITPRGGKSVYLDEGIPFIRSQNVQAGYFEPKDLQYISNEQNDKMASSEVKPKDILYNITGASIGRACLFPTEIGTANVNQHVCIVRLKANECNPSFAVRVMNSDIAKKHLYENQAGGGREGLNFQNLGNYRIPLPPLPEQEKIAEVLGCWDEGIQTLEDLIEQKRLRKKGLMQQLLTGKKRLPGFSEDWKTVKLGTIASIPKKQKLESVEGKSLLTVKLHCLGIEKNENTRPKLSEKGRPYFKRMAGEFLIGRQNFHNGGFGIVPKSLDGLIASNAITTLKIDQTKVCKNFLLMTFSNPDYYKRVGHRMDGTGQKELSEKEILTLDIPYPPLEEQKAISAVLRTADEEIALLEAELDALRKQKKGLMQKLLTGEVRCPEFRTAV
ncbi:restriction endonuclease subunit S [Verrucomicrobia bacterium S94]|nr:restriction endonuclease subunit S [Verrucomicrobia bacterium S94]